MTTVAEIEVRDDQGSTPRTSSVSWWPSLVLLLLPAAESIKSSGYQAVFGVDLTLLAIVLIAVVALPLIIMNGYPIKVMAPLMVFWSIEAISALRTMPSTYSDEKSRAFFFITGVAVFLLPAFIRTLPQVKGWLAVLLSASTVTFVLTVALPQATALGRITLGGNPLVVAYWCGLGVLMTALILVMSQGSRSWVRALLVGGVALFSLALLATGSRGPVIALLVALAVGLLGAGAKRVFWSVAVAVIVGGALYYAFRVAPEFSAERVVQVEDPSRVNLISLAFQTFTDNPLFGVGFGNFYWLDPLFKYPHNFIAEVAAEAGIIGLLSLIWVLVAFTRAAVLTRRIPAAWLASVAALFWLIAAFFSGAIEGRMLWLSVASVLLLPQAVGAFGVNPGSRREPPPRKIVAPRESAVVPTTPAADAQ